MIAPLKERLEPSAAFERVTEEAQKVPTWKITYSDPAKNTLEVVATSKLFHFADDLVIDAPNAGRRELDRDALEVARRNRRL